MQVAYREGVSLAQAISYSNDLSCIDYRVAGADNYRDSIALDLVVCERHDPERIISWVIPCAWQGGYCWNAARRYIHDHGVHDAPQDEQNNHGH